MPKKLIILFMLMFLGACAGQSGSGGSSANDKGRVVGHHDLILSPFTTTIGGQARQKAFETRGIEGWIQEDGKWSIQGPVRHTRLLCGNYRMGIQIGKGGNACGLVDWSTPVQYGPDRLQCNSATVVHSGGGQSAAFAQQTATANCVRVVVTCSGSC